LFLYVVWIYWLLPLAVDHLGVFGLVFAVGYLTNIFGIKGGKALVRLLKFIYRNRTSIFTPRRSLAFAGAIAAVTALLAVPSPVTIDGSVTFEPNQHAIVRTGEPGIVESILVAEGAHVEAGQTLATLRAPELHRDLAIAAEELNIARTRLDLLETGASPEEIAVVTARHRAQRVVSGTELARAKQAQRLRAMEVESTAGVQQARGRAAHAAGEAAVKQAEKELVAATGRPEEIEAAGASVRYWETRIAELQQRVERLRIVSPVSGVVVGRDLQDHIGERLAAGEALVRVYAGSSWRGQMAPLRGEPLNNLEPGQEVSMRIYGSPGESLVGRVTEVLAPEKAGESVVVNVEIETAPTSAWRVGMSGRARIIGPKRSAAYRLVVVPVIRIFDYDLWHLLGS
jgi:multidrug resistance efflux pump